MKLRSVVVLTKFGWNRIKRLGGVVFYIERKNVLPEEEERKKETVRIQDLSR